MCRVAHEQAAVHATGGDSLRAPRSLAHRLRWIGDQLEKKRAADRKSITGRNGGSSSTGGSGGGGSVKGIHLMCTAIQVTVLILFVRKRHL